ncbi:inosine-5'-monophosphate dehydrogenase [mine drainage metagenome]|uniref:Inosine-5'-monophosphate dehydrogenase n=1 Tax=mine drainage metagenome TaxID=410659 RepID=A0A1J5S369_9ZZZZ
MKTLQQVLDNKKIHDVISIDPNRLVFDALVALAEHKIGAILVLDGEKLAGIFSERDYAREVILKGRSSQTTKISEVMTSVVLTATPRDTVDYAMSLLSEKRIRHLPVIDNGKVVGILSIGDLVKETIEYQQYLIKQLEHYIQS